MRITALFALLLVAPCVGQASDRNLDGRDDDATAGRVPVSRTASTNVAIVQTDDTQSIADFTVRLNTLGYSPTLIPPTSNFATLSGYDLVVLPVSHASITWYANFDGLKDDYKSFVNGGGCLYVGQPNPMNAPNLISWLPYTLKLDFQFTFTTCTRDVLDASACTVEGLTGDEMPWPADTALEVGPEWTIVEESAGVPGLLVADYGAGHINVDLGHPSPQVGCPTSDACFAKMIECCLGTPPVPTRASTWGGVKSRYR